MYTVTNADLAEKTYHALKTMILRGELKPGEKLYQEKIAANLGISRTPLNSALNRLEKELLVEALPRRGFYVKELTLKELRDLYDVRLRLEPLGAREAAENGTPRHREQCRILLEEYQTLEAREYSVSFKERDYRFHNLIMEMSGNFFLQKMIASYNLISLGNLQLFMDQADFPRKTSDSLSEHTAILQTILEGDGLGAEEMMYKHIWQTRDLIDRRLAGASHGET